MDRVIVTHVMNLHLDDVIYVPFLDVVIKKFAM